MKYCVCYLTPLPIDYPMVGVKIYLEQIISAINQLDCMDLHVWRPEVAQDRTAENDRNVLFSTCTDLIVAGLSMVVPYLPRTFSSSIKENIFRWLRDLKPDLVLVTHPMFTVLVPELISKGYRVVVDTFNVEQGNARQLIRLAKSVTERAHAFCHFAVMRREERTLLPLAKEVWTVSNQDADQLNQIVKHRTPVALVPTVVDINRYQPTNNVPPNSVGFFADFSFFPNEVAAEQMLCNILPGLRITIPGVRLYLVGRNPSSRLRSLAANMPDVVVTGTVEDTRPWMDRCSVLLSAPIEQGSGTRLKILEALAMAKPMVSTPKECEGSDVYDGTHLMIRDLRFFPEAISFLLNDPGYAREIGQRGRRCRREIFRNKLAHSAG